MAGFAALLVALGIASAVYGAMQKYKSARLQSAPFAKTGIVAHEGAKVAGAKGAISTEGRVRVPKTLVSPVTGTPCLYYELTVTGSWKDGDRTESKRYIDEKAAAPFTIDDGSGPITIDASQGGDFEELKQTFRESKKEGLFDDLKSALGKGKPIQFRNYLFQNPVNSIANSFECVEKVLPVPEQLFVVGKFADGKISSPSWTSLILSAKSRDQVLESATKGAKRFLLGGGVCAATGLILGIVVNVLTP